MGKFPIFMPEMCGIGHRLSSEYLKSPHATWLVCLLGILLFLCDPFLPPLQCFVSFY